MTDVGLTCWPLVVLSSGVGVSALTDTGITEAMLEAVAKFDYVTWPGQCVI